jgi:hypothetical protein
MFARSSPHGSRGPAGLFRCPLPKRFNFGPDSLPRGTFGVAPRPSRPADAPRRFPLLHQEGRCELPAMLAQKPEVVESNRGRHRRGESVAPSL